jgi:hypothetical protein
VIGDALKAAERRRVLEVARSLRVRAVQALPRYVSSRALLVVLHIERPWLCAGIALELPGRRVRPSSTVSGVPEPVRFVTAENRVCACCIEGAVFPDLERIARAVFVEAVS